MEAILIKKEQKDQKFFKLFNTTHEHAKFEIQLRHSFPTVRHEVGKVKTDGVALFARLQFSHMA
eukprot:5548958-Ditylum_brightwellii.AAC.1